LAGLILMLFLRSLFYWQAGPAAQWTPLLSLGPVSVAFRADIYTRALLFSTLSFLKALVILYLWMLLLAMVNRGLADRNPIQRTISLQLGRFARSPAWLLLVLIPVIGALSWALASRLLDWLKILDLSAGATLWQQGFAVGLSAFLTWKYLMIGALIGHFINSLVYVGSGPLWSLIATTGRNLLLPLRRLPLTLRRLDLAPLLGIALVWMAARYIDLGLNWLFTHPLF
jgi:hypothetical protein